MHHAKEVDAYYKALTDQAILKLRAEGGFTEGAEQRLDKELARRGLTPGEAKREYAPEWLDKRTWAQSASSCLRPASGLLRKL
jgi:hypothetical protein